MSSSPSSFLPFSPSPSSSLLPSSSPPPPLLHPSTSAPLTSFDAPIDSPTSLSLFILRCREEIGHHARVLLATKLTNVNDEQIRQMSVLLSLSPHTATGRGCRTLMNCNDKTKNSQLIASDDFANTEPLTSPPSSFIPHPPSPLHSPPPSTLFCPLCSFLDTGGLDILLSWLEPTTNTAPVLSHTLDALSVLPLTSSHLSSHPSLLSTLTTLRSHTDETISQSADDLLATLERQRREGNDKEEKDIDPTDEGSRFRSIKIDKSTADAHIDSNAPKDEVQQPKVIAFEEAVSPPQSPPQSPPSQDVGDRADAVKAEEGMGVGRKRKRKGLSVTWQTEERLEDVRLFFKEEPIVKRDVKRQMTVDSRDSRVQPPLLSTTPLTPTLDWYPPPRLQLAPLLQTQLQARGSQSTEKEKQKEREKGVLRSVYIPNQEPANPTESPESLATPSVDDSQVSVIPFDVPKYAAPEAAAMSGDSKPSGAEFSNRTVELLSKLSSLSSLASLLPPAGGFSASASALTAPPAASPYAPYAPATSSATPSASGLSSLLSGLTAFSSSAQPSYPPTSPYASTPLYPPQSQPLPPPPSASHAPPPATAISSASTSKLLSLLSNKSAVSSLAAAFQQSAPPAVAPAPPTPVSQPYSAPQQTSYSPYTAPPLPPPTPVYPPPPPAVSQYAPPASPYSAPPPSYSAPPPSYYPHPPQQSAGQYAPLPQVSILS